MSLNVWGMKFHFFAICLPTKIAELLFLKRLNTKISVLAHGCVNLTFLIP